MEDKEKLDLEQIKRQFLEEFRSGKPTFGKDGGALAPILKHFLEAALDAEMDLHLDEEERGKGTAAGLPLLHRLARCHAL